MARIHRMLLDHLPDWVVIAALVLILVFVAGIEKVQRPPRRVPMDCAHNPPCWPASRDQRPAPNPNH